MFQSSRSLALLIPASCLLLALVGACSDDRNLVNVQSDETMGLAGRDSGSRLLPVDEEVLLLRPAPNPERKAYFGDLHIHTRYSFDAYIFGTIASPDDAYNYARGQPLEHPSGYTMQLREPLDFYAVTDHAMLMGLVREAADTGSAFSRYAVAQQLHDINAPDNMGQTSLPNRFAAFARFIPNTAVGLLDGSIDPDLARAVTASVWRDSIRAADAAYIPGQFTTFAAYEYTSSTDDRGNLHRNVIFRDTDRLPAIPFSRLHSQNPEGLWDWMDRLRGRGIESLAIPHNSNGSNGQMFKLVDWAGDPMDDEYAEQRLRNEPLVEITQVKGTSDTHPSLSKNDEWADFEIVPYRVATKLASEPGGSYVRDAYLRGLGLQEGGTLNPYRFGLVGASDTHTGAISQDEETFSSKAGLLDGTAERRGSVPAGFINRTYANWVDPSIITEVDGRVYMQSSSFEYWSASGLAAVWAEENTRESIYEAFRRKETFATSGPRIRLRFFASHALDGAGLSDNDLVRRAYDTGTHMGDSLAAGEASPTFLVWAVAEADRTPLQRLQVIKGWLENSEPREQVYDVACSDGLRVDPVTHRCPDNGAKVNPADCSISADAGAVELKTLWTDPDYRADTEAFYYVRALENPSCRWSTWDALRAGVESRSDLPATIQERAWSSPIWVRP